MARIVCLPSRRRRLGVLLPAFVLGLACAASRPMAAEGLRLALDSFATPPPALERVLASFVEEMLRPEPVEPADSGEAGRDDNPYGDTVFMRHRQLATALPDADAAALQAAVLATDVPVRLALLDRLTRSDAALTRYRALLEKVRVALRMPGTADAATIGAWLDAASAEATGLPPLFASDLAYMRAYLALGAGDLPQAWERVASALRRDPRFLRAHYLRLEIVDRILGRGHLSESQCGAWVGELVTTVRDVVSLTEDKSHLFYVAEHLNDLPGGQNAPRLFIIGVALSAIGRREEADRFVDRIGAVGSLPQRCRVALVEAAAGLAAQRERAQP